MYVIKLHIALLQCIYNSEKQKKQGSVLMVPDDCLMVELLVEQRKPQHQFSSHTNMMTMLKPGQLEVIPQAIC